MGAPRLFSASIRVVLLSAGILACGTLARAQYAAGAPPAHISFVEGAALVAHDGEWEAAVINLPLIEGDRIRTTAGRVQVLLPDGTAIDIDPYSEVEFVTATRIRVSAGSIERQEAEGADAESAAYLPQELQAYGGTFGRYGSWQNEAPYGAVWYPRVASTWRPYYHGYWAPIRSYGWTWVGFDASDWPTHHYGRWGYARGSWFWVPGRAWAPAWVSWTAAPGYVSWCPLGVNGSSVFALSIGNGDPWTGWTVVRRDTFGGRSYAAHRYAVEPHHLTRTTPFIIQSRAPVALAAATHPAAVIAPPSAVVIPPRPAGVAVPRDRTTGPARVSTPPLAVRSAAGAEGPSRAVEGRPPSTAPRIVGRAPVQLPRYATPQAVPRYAPSTAPRINRAPVQPPPAATPRAVPRYGSPTAARPIESTPAPARADRMPAAALRAERAPPGPPPNPPAAAPRGAPPSGPARARPAPQHP